jgi:type IV secretory pathway VirB3-like protein
VVLEDAQPLGPHDAVHTEASVAGLAGEESTLVVMVVVAVAAAAAAAAAAVVVVVVVVVVAAAVAADHGMPSVTPDEVVVVPY